MVPDALEKILGNLLSNSFKYSPAYSTITLTLECEIGKSHILITDTGVGMKSSEIMALFDRYKRASNVDSSVSGYGIGLAIVCKEYGLKLKIVIPKTQSTEKKETLKNLGAELIEVDAVPYSSPKNYIKQSKKLSEDLNKTSNYGVYWANQFDNTINTEAHIKTTAEEIWSQTNGQVDAFTCSVGTGGTLAGVSIGLKEKKKDIEIALSDPMGSSLYSYIKKGKLENEGNSITEGIGTGRITKNFEKALINDAFQTNDVEALNIVYDLIEKQKIVLGGSSGINIAGAIKLGKKMGPGKTIVTILCDHGKRYASKIFNKDFLLSKNLPIPKWL